MGPVSVTGERTQEIVSPPTVYWSIQLPKELYPGQVKSPPAAHVSDLRN